MKTLSGITNAIKMLVAGTVKTLIRLGNTGNGSRGISKDEF